MQNGNPVPKILENSGHTLGEFMRKAAYFLGFLLLIAGLGTLLLAASPSWQRRVGRPGGSAHFILPLTAARAAASSAMAQGKSAGKNPPPSSPSAINLSYPLAQPLLEALGDALPAE